MIIHADPRANITAHGEYKLYQFKKETVTPHSQ